MSTELEDMIVEAVSTGRVAQNLAQNERTADVDKLLGQLTNAIAQKYEIIERTIRSRVNVALQADHEHMNNFGAAPFCIEVLQLKNLPAVLDGEDSRLVLMLKVHEGGLEVIKSGSIQYDVLVAPLEEFKSYMSAGETYRLILTSL